MPQYDKKTPLNQGLGNAKVKVSYRTTDVMPQIAAVYIPLNRTRHGRYQKTIVQRSRRQRRSKPKGALRIAQLIYGLQLA